MGEIKITLESLYDLLRNEKKREDLQKLEGTFFIDVVSYLREKQALLESKQKSTELFAIGDREKLEYELRSIKRILKELYEKREKKILEIALNKSRTGSEIIDTGAMLAMEREFYHKVLRTLDDFRWGILQHLWRAELPNLPEQRKLEVEMEKKEMGMGAEKKEAEKKEIMPGPHLTASVPVAATTLSALLPSPPNKIRITHAIPSFVWKDLKVYGPYEEGEEIEMFPEVAELMVKKGRAMWVG